jgi:hypothetical protein
VREDERVGFEIKFSGSLLMGMMEYMNNELGELEC